MHSLGVVHHIYRNQVHISDRRRKGERMVFFFQVPYIALTTLDLVLYFTVKLEIEFN